MISVRQPGVITAASPSFADISAAISAASSGDTVRVPAGTATWYSQLNITKGINLIGAGIGNTIITGNVGNDAFIFKYEPSRPDLNEPFRISGFTFDCNNNSLAFMISNMTTTYPITKIRIDHNYFTNTMWGGPHYVAMNVYGTVIGVIDNNSFSGAGHFHVYGIYKKSWDDLTFAYGTANAIFIEDNTFILSQGGIVGSQDGGRWVARHNTCYYNNSSDLSPWNDAHGNGGGPGSYYANMGAEVYENTITLSNTSAGVKMWHHRGGMGLFYNNILTVGSSNYAQIMAQQEFDVRLLSTSNPIPREVSSAYYWGNRNGSSLPTLSVINDSGCYPTIAKNINCWIENPSFDGTAGVGVGLLSARPTTCTTGVAYWATDTQTLYRATATNVWTAYYQPYTYPHPLRSSM